MYGMVDGINNRHFWTRDLEPLEIKRNCQQPAFACKHQMACGHIARIGSSLNEEFSLTRLQGLDKDLSPFLAIKKRGIPQYCIEHSPVVREDVGKTVADLSGLFVELCDLFRFASGSGYARYSAIGPTKKDPVIGTPDNPIRGKAFANFLGLTVTGNYIGNVLISRANQLNVSQPSQLCDTAGLTVLRGCNLFSFVIPGHNVGTAILFMNDDAGPVQVHHGITDSVISDTAGWGVLSTVAGGVVAALDIVGTALKTFTSQNTPLTVVTELLQRRSRPLNSP